MSIHVVDAILTRPIPHSLIPTPDLENQVYGNVRGSQSSRAYYPNPFLGFIITDSSFVELHSRAQREAFEDVRRPILVRLGWLPLTNVHKYSFLTGCAHTSLYENVDSNAFRLSRGLWALATPPTRCIGQLYR